MLNPGQTIKEFESKKGNHVILRVIDKGDAPGFQKIINSIIPENDFNPTSKRVTLKEQEKWTKEMVAMVKKKYRVVICALVGTRLVGSCELGPYVDRQSHSGSIGMSIIKDYREEGIGTAFMEALLEIAKKEFKLKLIDIAAFATNKRALRLYKKFGFRQYGVLPRGYFVKNKYVDRVLLYKEL